MIIPYLVIMMTQWIHAWWIFPFSSVLQSTLFTTSVAQAWFIAIEHYRMRYDIADLFNAFLDFEKVHNGKLFYRNKNQFNASLQILRERFS